MYDLTLVPDSFWSKWPYDFSNYYIPPNKCMNPQTTKWRWIRKVDEPPKPSLGYDGRVCGFKCQTCGGMWKVYQNPYHGFGCPHAMANEEIEKAIKQGVLN